MYTTTIIPEASTTISSTAAAQGAGDLTSVATRIVRRRGTAIPASFLGRDHWVAALAPPSFAVASAA